MKLKILSLFGQRGYRTMTGTEISFKVYIGVQLVSIVCLAVMSVLSDHNGTGMMLGRDHSRVAFEDQLLLCSHLTRQYIK